jgi:murein DD-endopeptidase MepM/ murein hydrolase activator NlpD
VEVRPYRFYGGLFVRQRLSSEPDRYRGRRRVPTPPRSRYAVVGAAAFVGAGVVALGAGNSFPDAKALSPTVRADLQRAGATADDIANRAADSERANRSERGSDVSTKASEAEAPADVWLLPLADYDFTSGYGDRLGNFHTGIDLASPEGTPFKSIHSGTVTQAGYYGAYGVSVTVKSDDGVEIIYAHARKLYDQITVGQRVEAGTILGQVGNTGASYGTHLHVEVHKDGHPTDPIPLLRDNGVDIKLKIESVYGNLAAS